MSQPLDVNVNPDTESHIDLLDVDVNPPTTGLPDYIHGCSIRHEIAILWRGEYKIHVIKRIPSPGDFTWGRIAELLTSKQMEPLKRQYNGLSTYLWTPPGWEGV